MDATTNLTTGTRPVDPLRRRVFGGLVLGLLGIAACWYFWPDDLPMSSNAAAIIRDADRAEAIALEPPKSEGEGLWVPQHTNEQLKNPTLIPTLGEPVVVPDEVREELARLLLDPSSYLPRGTTVFCGDPVYGKKVRFLRGEEQVEVYFCFGCQQLTVLQGTTRCGGGYFIPAGRQIQSLIEKLFPAEKPHEVSSE